MLTIDGVQSVTERATRNHGLFQKIGVTKPEFDMAKKIFADTGKNETVVKTHRAISELGYSGDDVKVLMFKCGMYTGRYYAFDEVVQGVLGGSHLV